MLRRLQWSASQPAGSENMPKAKKEAVPSSDQFGIGAAVDHLEPDHHGRENQHHVMVEPCAKLMNPMESRRWASAASGVARTGCAIRSSAVERALFGGAPVHSHILSAYSAFAGRFSTPNIAKAGRRPGSVLVPCCPLNAQVVKLLIGTNPILPPRLSRFTCRTGASALSPAGRQGGGLDA